MRKVRITAARTIGALAKVHLGIDRGPTATLPLCGCTRQALTTVIEAANCRACITLAQQAGLNIEGLVEIPERIQRLINAVRVQTPEAAGFTNTELAELFRSCRTVAGALRKLAEHVP
jgi:hypothetical protein